jgi:hypothetical protein
MAFWPFRRKAESEPTGFSLGDRSERVISFVSPAEVKSLGGLPAEAVVGRFEGDDDNVSVESFQQNGLFVEFLHRVIRTAGPVDRELRAAAAQQGDGWVYIIDLRTPDGPQGRVPPEDIIGAFEVQLGQIKAEAYQPFPAHRVYTRNGLVVLPPSLRREFVRRLPRVS